MSGDTSSDCSPTLSEPATSTLLRPHDVVAITQELGTANAHLPKADDEYVGSMYHWEEGVLVTQSTASTSSDRSSHLNADILADSNTHNCFTRCTENSAGDSTTFLPHQGNDEIVPTDGSTLRTSAPEWRPSQNMVRRTHLQGLQPVSVSTGATKAHSPTNRKQFRMPASRNEGTPWLELLLAKAAARFSRQKPSHGLQHPSSHSSPAVGRSCSDGCQIRACPPEDENSQLEGKATTPSHVQLPTSFKSPVAKSYSYLSSADRQRPSTPSLEALTSPPSCGTALPTPTSPLETSSSCALAVPQAPPSSHLTDSAPVHVAPKKKNRCRKARCKHRRAKEGTATTDRDSTSGQRKRGRARAKLLESRAVAQRNTTRQSNGDDTQTGIRGGSGPGNRRRKVYRGSEHGKVKFLFPDMSPRRRNRLRFDEESLWSVTDQKTADQISAFALRLPEVTTSTMLIDGTACVGGNVLSFASVFEEVWAVEIDEDRFELLEGNVRKSRGGRRAAGEVKLFNKDFLDVLKMEEECIRANRPIVFLDPPWGGVNYKKQEEVDLMLSDVPLAEVCVSVFAAGVRHVLLKVPTNFRLGSFCSAMGRSARVTVHDRNMRKMLLVAIDNEPSDQLPTFVPSGCDEGVDEMEELTEGNGNYYSILAPALFSESSPDFHMAACNDVATPDGDGQLAVQTAQLIDPSSSPAVVDSETSADEKGIEKHVSVNQECHGDQMAGDQVNVTSRGPGTTDQEDGNVEGARRLLKYMLGLHTTASSALEDSDNHVMDCNNDQSLGVVRATISVPNGDSRNTESLQAVQEDKAEGLGEDEEPIMGSEQDRDHEAHDVSSIKDEVNVACEGKSEVSTEVSRQLLKELLGLRISS